MALDAICLAAVSKELRGRITGMKIDKVQQPERDLIVLSLHGGNMTQCRLLISSGTGDARIHLTDFRFDNPASPPMFCMLLRKHLIGARIIDITQQPAERVLKLTLEIPYPVSGVSEMCIIVELIGRMANTVLTGGDGTIIGALRQFGGELSDKRSILPGQPYDPPPAQQGKLDPYSVTAEKWNEMFIGAGGQAIDKWLLSNFTALSPLICRELSWRAYGRTDTIINEISDGGAALWAVFYTLMGQAISEKFEPWMLTDADNTTKDFSYTCIMQYENVLNARKCDSFSAMLDDYYTRTAKQASLNQKAAAMTRTVKNAQDKLIRKLSLQRSEFEKTAGREWYRECGDIIKANLHLMKKGHSILTANDFYSEEGNMREIPLDPRKTPQQNAEKYYKDYSKAKNAEKFLSEQIRLNENELEYLNSVLQEIESADDEHGMNEIRSELMQTGYIRFQKSGKEKPVESEPMRFESSTGMRITAGKNNAQNDRLTLKTAGKSDIWLHAQKRHGAHVIISCGASPPDEATLYEAASIAAYYSSARNEGKVPVDYTIVKKVKKPPGGRPGMVIYTDYKTIIATPDNKVASL